MVIVLVLLTFVALIAVGELLRWRELRRVADAAHVSGAVDLHLHPGHTWARPLPDGDLRVGATDLATGFIGNLRQIALPAPGTRLQAGQPVWTLVSLEGRRLTQAMPVDGEILEVNHALQRDPLVAQRSPYDAGWFARIRPAHPATALAGLLQGRAARLLLQDTRARVLAVMDPPLGRLAHDGGTWLAGFGSLIPDDDWLALEQELFARHLDNPTTASERRPTR